MIDNLHLDARPDVDGDRIIIQADADVLGHALDLDIVLGQQYWQASTQLSSTVKDIRSSYQIITADEPEWSYQGQVQLNLNVKGQYTKPDHFKIDYQLDAKDLTGDAATPPVATENLRASLKGSLQGKLENLRGQVVVRYDQGLLAYQDIILEPSAGPIEFRTKFHYTPKNLKTAKGSLHDPGGLKLDIPKAQINLDNPDQHQLDIHIVSARFPHIYTAWLQPLFYGTIFEELETEGQISANLSIRNTTITSLNFELADMNIADQLSRFSIYGLNGAYQGKNKLADGQLSIRYDGAELYRLLIGGTSFDFNIDNYNAHLSQASTIPVYGGELKVFGLSYENMDRDDATLKFDGVLTPVDLTALTHDLGWQPFSGSLSGVIPSVRYKNRTLDVDGILLAKAFDGSFRIKGLHIENFLGAAPLMSADFEVEELDLKKLTHTFDFGRIEGKLSGYIKNMQMSAWRPNSFEAFFYTPENDESRHIISQRAVDNLTSLSGSDIGSVLSRTYLRFLDNFRYEKLGIGCVLKNNICEMRGIAPAQGSAYYVVKSGFLPPRLDIIGYSHEVDWVDLVGRLKRVLSDNAPVIQ